MELLTVDVDTNRPIGAAMRLRSVTPLSASTHRSRIWADSASKLYCLASLSRTCSENGKCVLGRDAGSSGTTLAPWLRGILSRYLASIFELK